MIDNERDECYEVQAVVQCYLSDKPCNIGGVGRQQMVVYQHAHECVKMTSGYSVYIVLDIVPGEEDKIEYRHNK